MNFAVILLAAVLVTVLWSIYNMSEGFQSTPAPNPDSSMKCTVLKGAYDTSKARYDIAVKNNNTPVMNDAKATMNSLKTNLDKMGC